MPAIVLPHLDFESLVGAFSGHDRISGPILQPVIIPSLAFADHLQNRIADRFGVCMGFEFLMPQDFIHRAVGPGEESPWSKSRLLWKVLPHISAYAGALGVREHSVRDRFALAGVVADRLDQYGHFRPEMIRRWASGDVQTTHDHEAWQRDLWNQLNKEIPVKHPALQWSERFRDTEYCDHLAARYPRIQVLGSGTLDPLLVEVLEILAHAGSEVIIHIVLPSMGFLGDLRKIGSLPDAACDPEHIEISAGHPLLQSLGRQAVGAFLLLGKLDENYTHWPDPHEATPHSPTLLSRLQSDIRTLQTPQTAPANPNDTSIQIHSCFGPRREMEVLRDEILRAFDEMPDLKPDQVQIVTPDLATYAPLVAAVLCQSIPSLPVRVTEISATEMDPLIDAMLALLEMAHRGRFEAGDVLELLQKPAVLQALGGENEGHYPQWVRDSGLTQGFGDAPGQAAFARNRLIAGRFFGADSSARYPGDGAFVLPVVDQLAGELDQRSRFLVWISALEKSTIDWMQPAPASRWAERLQSACRDLLGATEVDAAGLEMTRAMAFLARQECIESLDAGTILDWMCAECSANPRRTGVAGRIAFGRFKQLHNLPCRVLAMVGMHDANFPARNRTPAWDLLHAEPRVWDRNPRIDDRQLFLDAVLTPTDRLIITSSTRNLRTRESEPFSSCVDELLRVVAAMGGTRPVIEQRLQPFAADYFQRDILPRSYDRLHAEVAKRISDDDAVEQCPFWINESMPASFDAIGEIRISQLVAFWKDPAKAFLKACGIYPADEEESDEELNRHPLSLNHLTAWEIKKNIIQSMISTAPQIDLLAARSSANRKLPPGHLGDVAWNQSLNLARPLGIALEMHRGKLASLQCDTSCGIRICGELLRTKDDLAWLTYRAGEFKNPKHFLEPWISALFTAACGDTAPIRIVDETHTDHPLSMDCIPPDAARMTLDALVAGYLQGQSRPLCFAPKTSYELIKSLDGKNGSRDAAIEVARSKWTAEDRGFGGGEGQDPCARLAWRDRDPFNESDQWILWSETVSRPMRKWGDI